MLLMKQVEKLCVKYDKQLKEGEYKLMTVDDLVAIGKGTIIENDSKSRSFNLIMCLTVSMNVTFSVSKSVLFTNSTAVAFLY